VPGLTDINTTVHKGNTLLKEDIGIISGTFRYGETAYHLPVIYALTGKEVHDATAAREVYLQTGENALVGAEILEAYQVTAKGPDPDPYTGFIGDSTIRKLGYSLVDGSILGLALVVGTPPSSGTAAAICRELQEKYMLTFLAGGVIPVLREAGVRVGLDYRLIPLGPTPIKGIHFVDILVRVAMMFGGVPPGDSTRLLKYASEQRAKAFAIVFPGLDEESAAFVDALRILGMPILSVGDYTGGDWIPVKAEEAVSRGMELKEIRVKVTAIPIPMGCSPAFEGKSIRKEEMYIEFGGGRSPAFELLRMRPLSEVHDSQVIVIGPEIEQLKEGSAVPLAILIDVAGKNMRKDYEPVLERRIHNFVNYTIRFRNCTSVIHKTLPKFTAPQLFQKTAKF